MVTSSVSKLLHSWLFIDPSEHHYMTQTSKFNNCWNRSSTMLMSLRDLYCIKLQVSWSSHFLECSVISALLFGFEVKIYEWFYLFTWEWYFEYFKKDHNKKYIMFFFWLELQDRRRSVGQVVWLPLLPRQDRWHQWDGNLSHHFLRWNREERAGHECQRYARAAQGTGMCVCLSNPHPRTWTSPPRT